MADFYSATASTSRGYRIAAAMLDDGSGVLATVYGHLLVANSDVKPPTQHAIPRILSRLAVMFPVGLTEALRLLEMWAAYYDPELRPQIVELGVVLAKLPAAAGPTVIFEQN